MTPRHPDAAQRQVLVASGVRENNIYSDAKGDTMQDVIRSVRVGTEVRVATAARLGSRMHDVADACTAIRNAGGVVWNCQEREYLTDTGFASFLRAQAEISGETRSPTREIARQRGIDSGGRPPSVLKMSDEKARALWHSKTSEFTMAERAAAIGLSPRACYDRFGTPKRRKKRRRSR